MKFNSILVLATTANAIRDGISNAIQNLLPPFRFNQLTNHGCWCSQANTSSINTNPGNNYSDDIDKICKQWFYTRRCSKLPGGQCNFNDDSEFYDIFNCKSGSACQIQTCEIDHYFTEELETRLESMVTDNSWTLPCHKLSDDQTAQETGGVNPGPKICVGSSPENLNIVSDGGVAAVESIVPNFPSTASFEISETYQGPVPPSGNLNDLNGADMSNETIVNFNSGRRKRDASCTADWSMNQPLAINQPHIPYTVPSISPDGPLSISFTMNVDHFGAEESFTAIMKLGDYDAVMDGQECLPCLNAVPGVGHKGGLGNSIALQYIGENFEIAVCNVHDFAFEERKTYLCQFNQPLL